MCNQIKRLRSLNIQPWEEKDNRILLDVTSNQSYVLMNWLTREAAARMTPVEAFTEKPLKLSPQRPKTIYLFIDKQWTNWN